MGKLLSQVDISQVDKVRRKGKKSINWEIDPEILARLESVSIMILQGAKLWQIAAALNCSLPTAQRDKARVKTLWSREASGGVNEHRERSIAHLKHLQMTAWMGYGKSKDHALLRLIGDWETDIIKLEGTEKPLDQNIKITDDRRPLKSLSDSELYALLSAKRNKEKTKPETKSRGRGRTRTSDPRGGKA